MSAALHYFRPLLGSHICRACLNLCWRAEWNPKYEMIQQYICCQTPEYEKLCLFPAMSDCWSVRAGGTGGWVAGSNQFKSQSMFNPVSSLCVLILFYNLQSMFYNSQCSLCSMFCPSRHTLVACQCNGECHPVMLNVMTESRKLVRRDEQARQAGE